MSPEDLKKLEGWTKDVPDSAPDARSDAPRSDVGNIARGVAQAGLGLIEAPAQLAERGIRTFAPSFKMPLHDWARDFRRKAEDNPEGIAGEVAGTLGMLAVPGLGELSGIVRGPALAARAAEVARPAAAALNIAPRFPAAARLAGAAERFPGVQRAASALERSGLPSRALEYGTKAGVGATMAQPVEGPDFWRQKGDQFLQGMVFGSLLGRMGMRGGKEPVFGPKGFATEAEGAAAKRPPPGSSAYNPPPKAGPAKGKASTGERIGPEAAWAAGQTVGHSVPFVGHAGRWALGHALGRLARRWAENEAGRGRPFRMPQGFDRARETAKRIGSSPYRIGVGAAQIPSGWDSRDEEENQ